MRILLSFLLDVCTAMKKEGSLVASFEAPCGRITRARAAACRANGKLPPLMPSVANAEKKQTRCSNLKRAAFDENSHGSHPAASQCKKKRTVLTDVTNMISQNSSRNWVPAGKVKVQCCLSLATESSFNSFSHLFHIGHASLLKKEKRNILQQKEKYFFVFFYLFASSVMSVSMFCSCFLSGSNFAILLFGQVFEY